MYRVWVATKPGIEKAPPAPPPEVASGVPGGGIGHGPSLIETVAWAVLLSPQPFVAVRLYVVVDCGCGMSVKLLAGNVPISWIVTLVPVPELSVTGQASRTDWLPPIVNAERGAVIDFIV